MPPANLPLALRFALREMRGGLSGFFIFIACIALGVGAIGGVNSVARSIAAGVASQGQTLLGGDLRFELNQREADGRERAFLDGLGTVSHTVGMRSMARLPDGSDQALVEVKAVDGAYPLYGALLTEPVLSRQDLFGERDGAFGATAPEGGCTQRSVNIAQIATATATAAAGTGSGIHIAAVTPTVAETRLPPMIDQGCASGLAGTANSSTAAAPIGAMNQGSAAPSHCSASACVPSRPSAAPTLASHSSRRLPASGGGAKPRSSANSLGSGGMVLRSCIASQYRRAGCCA